MESLARGTPNCFLEGVLEIEAMLDEFGTLGAHGGVLLCAITVRHVNDCAQTRVARGDRHALAVVASRCRDDAGDSGLAALQLVHVDKAAADLEGTDERMVLVLHPDLGARALREQRPQDLRCRRHNWADEVGRRFDCWEVRQPLRNGPDGLWHACLRWSAMSVRRHRARSA